MADLGAVAVVNVRHPLPTLHAVTDYDVVRGNFLGVIGVADESHPHPPLRAVSNYVVRQIRVVYRQLWPSHGQRFPQ